MALDKIIPPAEYDPRYRDFGLEHVRPGDACFYCSKAMEVGQKVIVWRGHGPVKGQETQIAMHPPCAIDLSMRLNRDAYDAGVIGAFRAQ